ncbi:CHAT domain-containing protein [Bizionia sp. KMM 8389]
MKSILYIFLIVCFTNFSIAQNKTDSIYNTKITNFYLKAYKHMYAQEDSAYYYFNAINKEAQKHDDFEIMFSSISFSNKTAAHFYNLKKMRANLNQLDSLIITENRNFKNHENYRIYINSIALDKGIYYFRLNDYDQARKSFQSIIASIEDVAESDLNMYLIDLLSSAYSFIAKMYVNDGKYQLAKAYYKKNIHFLEIKKANDIIKINRTYSLLAEVLKNENDIATSNKYFKKSLEYSINHQGNLSSIITDANHLLENYLQVAKLDSARYYLKVIKNHLIENHPKRYIYHEAKSKINEAEHNFELATDELQIALQLVQKKWQNKPHNDVAEIYNKLGLLHARHNQAEQAIVYYNLAQLQLETSSVTSTINQSTRLKTENNKAKALNSLSLFPESLTCVSQAINTLDSLKPSFKNNTDKLFLIENAYPIFESGIEAAYNLYQSDQQDSLISKAFHFFEKSKAVLLMDAMQASQATTYANIPNEITEKENLLKSQINYISKQLNQQKTPDLEDALFQTTKTYHSLIDTIETKYKAYYNLKYNTDVISVSQLQKFLDSQTAIVSYFYGSKAIYSITITNEDKVFKRIDRNTGLDNSISTVYNALNNPKFDLDTLNNLSFQLYEQLLQSTLYGIHKEKLIIIPDGKLNYLPFSALSTNGSTQYLILNHAISYANSATLLTQLSQKKITNSNILAFAPSFDDAETEGLLPLAHNKKEASSVLKHFQGTAHVDHEATLQNFNSESANFGILHFATHAVLNNNHPEYSYLAFQPNKNLNHLLYVSDLYNLSINSSLVTLSACESGIGDLNLGEGFISLARGFYFSGASSICSTLWKINDASSLKIMDAFYKNLSEGNLKQVALQKAQLRFLNENKDNSLSHPYYWSAFVLSGDTQAIVESNYVYWLLALVIGILLVILIFKLRKQNTT